MPQCTLGAALQRTARCMPTLMQAVSSLVQLKRTAQGLSHHGPTVNLVDNCTLLCHFRHEQCCYYQFHNYIQPAYRSRAQPAGEHAHRLVTSAKHRHTDSYWHVCHAGGASQHTTGAPCLPAIPDVFCSYQLVSDKGTTRCLPQEERTAPIVTRFHHHTVCARCTYTR